MADVKELADVMRRKKGGEKKDRVMTEVYKNTRAGIHSLQI